MLDADSSANPHHLDARRYFKQSEIVLYRQAPDGLAQAVTKEQPIITPP